VGGRRGALWRSRRVGRWLTRSARPGGVSQPVLDHVSGWYRGAGSMSAARGGRATGVGLGGGGGVPAGMRTGREWSPRRRYSGRGSGGSGCQPTWRAPSVRTSEVVRSRERGASGGGVGGHAGVARDALGGAKNGAGTVGTPRARPPAGGVFGEASRGMRPHPLVHTPSTHPPSRGGWGCERGGSLRGAPTRPWSRR
jgi:hypothetical protein